MRPQRDRTNCTIHACRLARNPMCTKGERCSPRSGGSPRGAAEEEAGCGRPRSVRRKAACTSHAGCRLRRPDLRLSVSRLQHLQLFPLEDSAGLQVPRRVYDDAHVRRLHRREHADLRLRRGYSLVGKIYAEVETTAAAGVLQIRHHRAEQLVARAPAVSRVAPRVRTASEGRGRPTLVFSSPPGHEPLTAAAAGHGHARHTRPVFFRDRCSST